MKIDLISYKKTWENKKLLTELKKRKIEHAFVDPRLVSYVIEEDNINIYLDGKKYEIPDVVLCRGGFTKSVRNEGRILINILSLMGVKIIDSPKIIYEDVDKLFYSAAFAKHKIPHVKTMYLGTKKDLRKIDFSPIVVKPMLGSKGVGIYKTKKIKDVPKKTFFIQKLFPNSNQDIRVLVIGGKAIGGILRTAKKGEWRSNVALGGKVKPIKINNEIAKLAVRAAKCCEVAFAGVDILTDDNGRHCVVEVNRAPQFRGFMTHSNIDVPKYVIDFLINSFKSK